MKLVNKYYKKKDDITMQSSKKDIMRHFRLSSVAEVYNYKHYKTYNNNEELILLMVKILSYPNKTRISLS